MEKHLIRLSDQYGDPLETGYRGEVFDAFIDNFDDSLGEADFFITAESESGAGLMADPSEYEIVDPMNGNAVRVGDKVRVAAHNNCLGYTGIVHKCQDSGFLVARTERRWHVPKQFVNLVSSRTSLI